MKTELKEFKLFINGQLVPAKENKFFDTINPSIGEVFARIADAGIEDMQQAIQAARNAFDNGPWGRMTPAERGIYLKKIAKLVRQHAKELAEIELNDTGKTSKQTTFIDVPTCADTFDAFSNFAHALEGQSNPVNMPVDSRTIHEPFGVVGCIVPWNYPLIYIGWKMAPALMAGNTIVYKPSPLASASTLRFAEMIKDIGLPEGVINIVTTNRTEVAEELVKNPAVDMISFTGGTETGKHIIRMAAETVKKVSPELGGKSPNIVLADCDRQAALGGTLTSIFMNQGQMCTAGSRLLLEDAIYDEFLTELIKKTRTLKIGPAHETGTAFGPMISREHRDKVLQAI
ncbi:MAG: aldehyde dehydrogenase family protein, partial [Candidatus Omnitrophica bacterium]|nr:aldehyde dehydrogenase family protein [Candidatus Omnitrophota bacterium]